MEDNKTYYMRFKKEAYEEEMYCEKNSLQIIGYQVLVCSSFISISF